jgi:hypothetical protein
MLGLEAEYENEAQCIQFSPEKLFAGSNIENKGKSGWHPVNETMSSTGAVNIKVSCWRSRENQVRKNVTHGSRLRRPCYNLSIRRY